jgi:hypothetical protein
VQTDPIQVGSKTVEALAPAVPVSVTLLDGAEARLLEVHFRLPSLRGELDGHQQFILWIFVPDKGVLQALGRHELAKDAVLSQYFTIWSAHPGVPRSTGDTGQLDDRSGESVRSPPLFRLFGVRPRFPHDLARRIEGARDQKRSIRG